MSDSLNSAGIEIAIREHVQADEAFLFETWLKGAKRGTYECKRIRDSVYYARRHALIERILARGAHVLVATPPGDPDTILGYLVVEDSGARPVLHWCYVKLPWRRLGIATRLITRAVPDPNKAIFTAWTVWSLSVPAPKGVDRGDRRAVRDARTQAVKDVEQSGEGGGDTDDLLRKWPGLEFDPDARFDPR